MVFRKSENYSTKQQTFLRKREELAVMLSVSINFNGNYRCSTLQRKHLNIFATTIKQKSKQQPPLSPYTSLLLPARWALGWLQRCSAVHNSPIQLQVSQPH